MEGTIGVGRFHGEQIFLILGWTTSVPSIGFCLLVWQPMEVGKQLMLCCMLQSGMSFVLRKCCSRKGSGLLFLLFHNCRVMMALFWFCESGSSDDNDRSKLASVRDWCASFLGTLRPLVEGDDDGYDAVVTSNDTIISGNVVK